jgi:hypothetical protein
VTEAGSGRLSRRKRLAAICAAVVTVIGVLGTATDVFDKVRDLVDPPPDPPPETIDARIQSVALRGAGEPLADYLRRTGQPTDGLTPHEGAEPGFVFLVRIRLRGNEDRRLPLSWAVVDASSGRPLPGPVYNQTAVEFEPRGPDQSRTWQVWVPEPPSAGRYRLRTMLADEDGRPLDERTSAPYAFEPSSRT